MNILLKAETRGYVALIDEEDYDRCVQHKWYMSTIGYFYSRTAGLLHTFLLGPAPEGLVTDHINQNKQDNRKENLRFITQAQNMANTKRHLSENHSIFRQAGLFRVRLTRNKQQYHVGYYRSVEEARTARDKFIETHFDNVLLTR